MFTSFHTNSVHRVLGNNKQYTLFAPNTKATKQKLKDETVQRGGIIADSNIYYKQVTINSILNWTEFLEIGIYHFHAFLRTTLT